MCVCMHCRKGRGCHQILLCLYEQRGISSFSLLHLYGGNKIWESRQVRCWLHPSWDSTHSIYRPLRTIDRKDNQGKSQPLPVGKMHLALALKTPTSICLSTRGTNTHTPFNLDIRKHYSPGLHRLAHYFQGCPVCPESAVGRNIEISSKKNRSSQDHFIHESRDEMWYKQKGYLNTRQVEEKS
ncbi:hypothetical protein CH063_03542 [Colletotrichum higginsianum]|uniref:Uncharacterized protein n=1 Tax=Colletotrichum higginsianum (strain IMI 349063) TaxID=759273 RepID=H1VYA3_COLHI|nr:hypothetical protein CH063_03542 [Colletotrichum higginsianum]